MRPIIYAAREIRIRMSMYVRLLNLPGPNSSNDVVQARKKPKARGEGQRLAESAPLVKANSKVVR